MQLRSIIREKNIFHLFKLYRYIFFQRANTLCLTTCKVVNGGDPFSVSTANTKEAGGAATSVSAISQIWEANCNNDYVIIPGGYDPTVTRLDTTSS